MDHFLYSLILGNYIDEGFRIISTVTPSSAKNLSPVEGIKSAELLIEPGSFAREYNLHFKDYLQVIYNKKDSFTPQTSWIKLTVSEITLDKFGYPEEVMPFEIYGYWAKSGLADLLPKYFGTQLYNDIHVVPLSR